MSDLEITKLVAQDRSQWETLFRGYQEFYGRSLEPAADDRAWTAFREDSVMHARGARLDGRLVSVTHFLTDASTSAPDVCGIQDLFTAPEARRRGAARALILAVATWVREQHCSRVYWLTHESNASARELYDKVAVNRGFIRYEISL